MKCQILFFQGEIRKNNLNMSSAENSTQSTKCKYICLTDKNENNNYFVAHSFVSFLSLHEPRLPCSVLVPLR